jgi:hypothetical protein
MEVSQTNYLPVLALSLDPPNSAFQVARITGVSHQSPVGIPSCNQLCVTVKDERQIVYITLKLV